MASGTITVSMRANVRLAVAYLRLLKWLVPVLGVERAWRWSSLSYHLIFIKIGRGRWQRPLSP